MGTRRKESAKKSAKHKTPEYAPPVESDPLLALLNSQSVHAQTPLQPGDSLQVESGGEWWNGEVVEVLEDGSAYIHFPGWESSWDEVVPRSRMRLNNPGPKRITVFLDNSQAITGDLETCSGDFLVLTREGSSGKTFVNKHRILYLEIAEGSS